MLVATALDAILALGAVLSFATLWATYATALSTTQGRRHSARDLVRARRQAPSGGASPSALGGWAPALAYWLVLWLTRGHEGLAWGHHLHLSNPTLSLFLALGFLALATHLGGSLVAAHLGGAGGDYSMSLAQLCLYLPMVVLSNTLLTLFFFMEGAAVLIFYNFVTTRALTRLPGRGHRAADEATTSKHFFGLLFFHFWASFFSAALLVYGTLNLYLLFGTTEWQYLSLLARLSSDCGGQPRSVLLLAALSLLVGFWVKMGLAPFFVYKVEVYRGLPLPALVFYSVLYFTIFGVTLLVLNGYYFTVGLVALRPLAGLVLLASLFLALALYDSQALRNFFALSSVLAATNVLMALVA
jgi:formate hydrogenlyase subunit 3/multisubunit Na+/H+ antiporter MnhD subunit